LQISEYCLNRTKYFWNKYLLFVCTNESQWFVVNCFDEFHLRVLILLRFKYIYLSSIVKQVLATYINHFQVRFLEPTTTAAISKIMVETRDLYLKRSNNKNMFYFNRQTTVNNSILNFFAFVKFLERYYGSCYYSISRYMRLVLRCGAN
jgi:hypothetical protein